MRQYNEAILDERGMWWKKCPECGETKILAVHFPLNKSRPGGGYGNTCKPCHSKRQRAWYQANKRSYRERVYQREFGISLDEYERLWESQQGRCKLCDRHQDDLTRWLAVDHDHATGRVRALLCGSCNTALGCFEKYGVSLDRLRAYLEQVV